jgi:hypothetical protein
MARREDWPERLLAEIERHSHMPFEYGTSDCFIFPMDCVEAMTGNDPWAGQRGYRTDKGAAGRLRRQGFKNVGDAFADKFEEIPVGKAGRGDIGVIETDKGTAGVVFIDTVAMGKAEDVGVKRVPRSLVTRAFRVS